MRRFSLTNWSNEVKRQVPRGGPRQAERSARKRFVPRLESLEDRTVPSHVFFTFDDPNAGTGPGQGTGIFPGINQPGLGINEVGQIVGTYLDANFSPHGFLLSNGHYTTLDDPNATPFFPEGAFGINTRGQIVGMYSDMNGTFHGFLLRFGQYTTLDDPNAGAGGTVAQGINEVGQIVGYYYDVGGTVHGFLLSGGHYTALDDPNAGSGASQGTLALGINSLGQVVGDYVDASFNTHGFLLSGGQYTTLDDPNGVNSFGAKFTVAQGINELGQIVGYYQDATTVHGFLLSNGQYTTLDDPNAGIFGGTQASAINVFGTIVGFYVDINGIQHGFLATPGGGHSASPGGEGSRGLGDIHSGETTTGGMVQRTVVGDEAQSAFGRPGQDLGSRMEIFFAARLTGGKHANITGTDLSPSNDDFPLAD
jgi:probable HAF family extracellular repeat protein